MSTVPDPFQCVLIRNVMVGRKGLTRSLLLEAFTAAGGGEVRSLLATGNIVFRAADSGAALVVERAARLLREAVGLTEPCLLRSAAQLLALQRALPFADAPSDDVAERFVTFLSGDAPAEFQVPFVTPRRDFELFRIIGPQVFGVTRRLHGSVGSPNAVIEKRTGLSTTTRNWNTIERMIRSCL